MKNQFVSRFNKSNAPLFGYNKTNDDEMDKLNEWQRNTGEWKEGDKNTKGIMETSPSPPKGFELFTNIKMYADVLQNVDAKTE